MSQHSNFSTVNPPARPVGAPARRGGRFLFFAAGVAQISSLLRYVVLARLLGPEQLGLASTLVVTATFFDLISDTGSDRFLIQDRNGDAPEAQQLVHLVMVMRGSLIALGLVLAAWPASIFFKEPRLQGAIMVLALSPLILSAMHFDYRRMQRHLDFRAEAMIVMVGECVSVIFSAGAAYLTRDFTSVLYGLIARAIAMVLISHLRATRPYRVGFSAKHAQDLFKFSGPLLINGVLLFLGSQGDRVLIANRLGVKELGFYSATLLLIYYPAAMLMRYVHAMYLPIVAGARDDVNQESKVIGRLAGETLLLSAAMVAGFVVVAPSAVVILFGHRYKQTVAVIALIGVLQTLRYMIVWPTTVALGRGDSRSVLAINIVRIAAYPAAIVGGSLEGGLSGVTGGFIVGEAIALLAGVAIVNRRTGVSWFENYSRITLFAVICGCILAATIFQSLLVSILFMSLSAVSIVWAMFQERVLLAELANSIAITAGFRSTQ